MGELSAKDLTILDELQQNCRIPFKEIAKKADVPLSTVYAKIEKFEKDGLIEGYHAKLNKKKLGVERTAFVMVSYERMAGPDPIKPREMAKGLAKLPAVQDVYLVAGEWDVILKICSKKIDHIASHLTEEIRMMDGVSKSLTYVCLDEAKNSTILPIKNAEQIK